MKEVLYFSMACNEEGWIKIQSESTTKGSISPLIFDRLLLKGLSENECINLTIYSFPSIPSFPQHFKVFWSGRKETILSGLQTHWLPFINIPIIKQLSHFLSSLFVALHWASKRIGKEGIIAVYSQYPPIVLSVLLVSKLFSHKCLCVITDIPEFMFLNQKIRNRHSGWIFSIYLRLTNYLQQRFDKYVFLTEEMNQLINKRNVKYTIIEGIGDPYLFENLGPEKVKKSPKTIMYAGSLNQAVGIQILIKVINEISDEYTFWIFGTGDQEQLFTKLSQEKANVKYFGMVSRAEILERELQASLLINLRNPADKLTRYSFPSKIIEYMSSGTPVLSTRLKGIPNEYFKYIFTIDVYDARVICDKIDLIFKLDDKSREEVGRNAKLFIYYQKNYKVQSNKLLKLIFS